MDPIDEKKPGEDCDEDCECKDCVERCLEDDERIQVSVSPRRFGLPPAAEKKTKMEIKNKNAYPIYFKASTSNTNVFRPVPDNGCITPNGKASVDVQFYNSAVPIRRHEEVIVFTSAKPFEQYALYKERVCPFCMEPFEVSKHHNLKGHGQTEYCSLGHSYENGRKTTHTVKDYAQYERKDKIYNHGLKEICIHAFVHESADSACECKNCVELGGEMDHRKKLELRKHQYERRIKSDESVSGQTIYTTEKDLTRGVEDTKNGRKVKGKEAKELELRKQKYERRIKSDESVSGQTIYTTEKDLTRGVEDTKKDRKVKGKEAHILARVLRAESAKDALSDTSISELSRREEFVRKTKIISEEDYNRKREKLIKKRQKQRVEEAESILAEEQPDKSDEKMTEMERKSMLTLLDEKCSTLVKLSWTNLSLLMLLMTIVVGGFFCCYNKSEDTAETYRLPCFFDLFN